MKRLSVFFISILVSYVFMAVPVYTQDFDFPFNNTMTTDFGPAFADIILQPLYRVLHAPENRPSIENNIKASTYYLPGLFQ